MGGKGSGAIAGDLTMQKFNRLTVVRRVPNGPHRKVRWLCKCDCGNETVVVSSLLRTGNTGSCGCYALDTAHLRARTHGHSSGGIISSEYNTWAAMIQRCNNPKNSDFKYYGGRGISVCERWMLFENFYADMGDKPSPKHSIDRKNTNGNYEPSNCEWANHTQQTRNARSNIIVNFRGRDMCLSEAAEVAGVNYQSLYDRVGRKGWEINRAVNDLL